jgi:two-component system response regulator FixJ
MAEAARIWVVDDDEGVRNSLQFMFESMGRECSTYSSGEAFLEELDETQFGCVITDLRMPGISGLQLLDRLSKSNPNIHVILVSGYGDVSTAVRALRGGAVNFLEKPYREQELIENVDECIAKSRAAWEDQQRKRYVISVVETLTTRELEVMLEVAKGDATKVIARSLDISPKTVEVHRSNAYAKLETRSVIEIKQMLSDAGITPA